MVLYAGSIALGDVTIGDDCVIGANSIVMNDFPGNSMLVGTSVKIIASLK